MNNENDFDLKVIRVVLLIMFVLVIFNIHLTVKEYKTYDIIKIARWQKNMDMYMPPNTAWKCTEGIELIGDGIDIDKVWIDRVGEDGYCEITTTHKTIGFTWFN